MIFGARVTIQGPEDGDLTPDVVESVLDCLFDLDVIDDVESVGSLASKEIELELTVHALDIDEAQASVSSAIRFALQQVGGELASDDFRKTDVQTRELADA